MTTSKEISVGREILIPLNGEVHHMRITEIKDGKVTLAKCNVRGRGRWWLLYSWLRENASPSTPASGHGRKL